MSDTKREELLKLAEMARARGDDDVARRALMQVEAMEPKEESFSTFDMIGNIPSSAAQYAGDIYTAVSNPRQTVEGLYNLGNSALQNIDKAMLPYLPDWFVENTNRSQNWLAGQGLPLSTQAVKKEDMTYSNLEPGQAFAGLLGDRYGSYDKTMSTLESDPVGLLGDAATVLSLGGGIAPKLGRVGRAIDPVNLTKNLVKTPVGKLSKKIPQDMYKSAVKFSTTLDEAKRTKLAQTALDEGIMPTGKGLDYAHKVVSTLNDSVNALIDQADNAGKRIPVKAVFKKLKDLRKEVGGAKAEGASDLKKIDRYAKQFSEHMKKRGQTHMTVRELQEFKVDLYHKIYGDKIALRTIPEKDMVRDAFAKGAREIIETEIPEVKALNQREGALLGLTKALDRPASRIDNLNYISIDPPVKAGAGYAVGKAAGVSPELAATVGFGAGLLGAPKLKARNAILLNKMIDASKPGLLTNDPIIRSILQQGLFQAGRGEREDLF